MGNPNLAGEHNPAYKHGHTAGNFSPEYQSWSGMIQRCTNPKREAYKHYGARGIKVCKRWLRFENFLADMGLRPSGLTLERKKNHLGYTPSNCIWGTRTAQSRNSSQVVWVTINGIRKRLVEWCETYQISINTVRCRVRTHGWSYRDAITRPKQAQPFR